MAAATAGGGAAKEAADEYRSAQFSPQLYSNLSIKHFTLRSVLSELTRNDKTQINLLTILAEDYASYAEEIANVIEETLIKVCEN